MLHNFHWQFSPFPVFVSFTQQISVLFFRPEILKNTQDYGKEVSVVDLVKESVFPSQTMTDFS